VLLKHDEQIAPTVATPNQGEVTPPSPGAGDGLGMKVMGARLKGKLFSGKQSFPKCGRFEVRGQLGAGGMGVVFEGWDPDLERKVALKVLPESASESGKQRKRMVREAQTLAKLSHPNVVQVYEVGMHEDRLFIAMEYVEGETLRSWLRREKRAWKDVLARYVDAGRGLVAAHAEGLVHRDFKPDNVMVTKDGEVRVLDFGLAREELGDDALSQLGQVKPDELTQTGTMLGTPLYMAPEQFEGKATDARTDQFSFCVALWEGLHSERPFQAETIDALSERVRGGELENPGRGDAPSWVHRVLLQGLSTKPEDRMADMPALLAALTPRRRSPWAIGSAFVGLGGLGVATGVFLTQPEPPPLCPDLSAELDGSWDTRTQEQLKRRILDSGRPDADAQWERVRAKLDAWTESYLDAARENCEATRVAGTQSPETMRVKASCLDARLQEMRAMTDAMLEDDRVLPWAAPLSATLTGIDSCSRTKTAEIWPALPDDPAESARVRALRGKVALLGVSSFASTDLQSELTVELWDDVAKRTEGPLKARYLASADPERLPPSSGIHSHSEALEMAFWEAERAGDDRTAALTAAYVAALHSYHFAGTELRHRNQKEAEMWREHALVKAERPP
jgi:serine/threonine protein kinase